MPIVVSNQNGKSATTTKQKGKLFCSIFYMHEQLYLSVSRINGKKDSLLNNGLEVNYKHS